MPAHRASRARQVVDAHLWPFVKFALVGVANTLVYLAVYLVLHPYMPYLAAHAMGWLVGLTVSFLLNCWFTYRVRPTLRRALLFPLASLPNIALSTVGVVLLVEWLGVDETLAPLIATVLAIPMSFLLTRALLTGSTGGRSPHPDEVDASAQT